MDAGMALIAFALALLHLLAGRLPVFGDVTPRSVWLSAAGGVSVAYVFLHLMPELHEGQHAVRDAAGLRIGETQSEIYLVALAGLTIFYGLERLAARSRAQNRAGGGEDRTSGTAFGVHMGAFAVYNMLIGYLLVHGEQADPYLYAVAMGLHFAVNDRALRAHHKRRYDHAGRWLLAAAVVAGWLAAQWVRVPELATAFMTALLAGGVILNVMKEELPEQRESRFFAFLAGAAAYGGLLLML